MFTELGICSYSNLNHFGSWLNLMSCSIQVKIIVLISLLVFFVALQPAFCEPPENNGDSNGSSKENTIISQLDPCLPKGFHNWKDAYQSGIFRQDPDIYVDLRIVIDRASYTMVFQGLTEHGRIEGLYRSRVGLGTHEAMTPVGLFHINHLYCYPGVIYFTDSGTAVKDLYAALFAPLLKCDSKGNCYRYEQLGIHGLNPTLLPSGDPGVLQLYGPVSEGCVRLPDPCGFKRTLIHFAGIGPIKRNDRGYYHWLNKPVRVEVVDEIGWSVFTSLVSAIGSLFEVQSIDYSAGE